MTDVPPPLPPVGTRLDASIAEQARQSAADAVAAAQAPPADPGAALLAEIPESLMMSGTGTVQRRFRSRKAADVIRLTVDDAVYACSGSAPGNLLVEALDARSAGDQGRLMVTMRKLVLGVLLPDDRARYEARLDGGTTETADGTEADFLGGHHAVTVIGTPGQPVNHPPIDIVDMIAHGLWLVGTYFARPTQPSGSSDSGR
jgi:hypothetical protein